MKDIQIQFNSDISKDNTDVRIAFYTNIGFFIEVAQILEFNLRKLICYELSVKEIEKYEELLKRYEKANVEYGRIQDEKLHKIGLSQKLESFIKDLENRPASIDYFDETTFRFMVESVKVSRDKKLTFKFRNGKEIEV